MCRRGKQEKDLCGRLESQGFEVKDLVVEELQQCLWRGSELANEEFRKVEVGKEYDGVAMDLMCQVDSERRLREGWRRFR